MPQTIVVTDLDGTLLDSETYSFSGALPALKLIRERGVPLILCSSKTRAEMEVIRRHLDNDHPFISENGGGIFIPQGYFSGPIEAEMLNGYQRISLGKPYADIRRQFIRLRDRIQAGVKGFGDMSAEEVSALTGLSRDDAELAKQRDFDEPFVFDGAVDERFLSEIEAAGLRWTRGRIFHITGGHEKGEAVKLLKALYQRQFGAIVSIGLGDGLNDLPLLQSVDYPVLVRHEDGDFDLSVDIPHVIKTKEIGPAGWNEEVLRLLAAENV